MKCVARFKGQVSLPVLLIAVLWQPGVCQSNSSPERAFPQSKDSIEQMVKKLQPAMSGRLPVLDGFVSAVDQPLDHYRRAYYQTAVQVISNSSKGSVVRVSTKITAWYTDPAGVHSGYRLLNSNGRLESDLLDQLSDELTAKTAPVPSASADATGETTHNSAEQTAPPPVHPPTSAAGTPFSAPLHASLPARDAVSSAKKAADPDLQEQIRSLEEVLRNQGHPNNLVAIKQAGTAVVASPSLTAKTLFLASAHDEFEMLDFNADWVHVRVSGLSRGWIWRNSVEMPEGIPDTATRAGCWAQSRCRATVPRDPRGDGSLPGRLGTAEGQERQDPFHREDERCRNRQRIDHAAGVRQVRTREELQRSRAEVFHAGGHRSDLRFRRWRHDCCHATCNAEVESRHSVGLSLLAAVFL